MTLCRLCNRSNNFGKSHVIPEAFFRPLRNGAAPSYLIADGAYPKRSPIGIYDSGILCQECERKFGPLDDYGVNVLLNNFDALFAPVLDSGSVVVRQSTAGEIDQERLLRFFVSVLWRASVSTQSYYNRVQLGPHEVVAAQALVPGTPIDSRFAVALSCWRNGNDDDSQLLSKTNMDPFSEKWDGVNAYRFYFGDVVAYIKVDKRPFPKELDSIALGSRDYVMLVAREFMSSSDLSAMQETMRRAKKPSNRMPPFM